MRRSNNCQYYFKHLKTNREFSRISDARTFRYSGLGGVVGEDDGVANQSESTTAMVTDQADDAGSEKAGKPSPLKSWKDGGESLEGESKGEGEEGRIRGGGGDSCSKRDMRDQQQSWGGQPLKGMIKKENR